MTQTEALKLALEGAANYIDVLGGDGKKYRQLLAQQSNEQVDELAAYNEWLSGTIHRHEKARAMAWDAWMARAAIKTHPPVPTAQPKEPAPEWMTEEEQTAYTFGWFKALEHKRLEQSKEPEQEPVAWMFEFPDKRLAPKFDSAPHGGNWQPLYKGKNT